MRKFLTFVLIFIGFSYLANANNLQISTPTLTGQNTTDNYTHVQFNVSWENSWRDATNWDAVWLYVKYKKGSDPWKHTYLSTSAANHSVLTPSVPYSFEVGTTDISGNKGMGVFLHRSTETGPGNVSYANVKLRWDYSENGLVDNDNVEVKVFGIEMVYIPGGDAYGAFRVGDGGSTNSFFASDGLGGTGAFESTYLITTQGAIDVGNDAEGKLWANGAITTGTTDPLYPNGFNPFYIMKYEITNKQYVDFLNTLSRADQDARTTSDLSGTSTSNTFVMSKTSAVNYRSGVKSPGTFSATGPIEFFCETGFEYVAANHMNWGDCLSFADWAGLRPMTELEYEKASRGKIVPVVNEYAWGTINIHSLSYLPLVGEGTSAEYVTSPSTGSNGNCNYYPTNLNATKGPFRTGIFATGITGRVTSGASVYGVMEMSGNVWEQTVPITFFTFTGNHGDGSLNALPTGWPTGTTGSGVRGGNWFDVNTFCRISNRGAATYNDNPNRKNTFGIRVVRSAN